MKAELVDVNDTRKSLSIEVPRELVDAEIDRVARDYGRKARIPGFRPGKVPSRVIRQRFRHEILHDVTHELVPRAVDAAVREKGVEPQRNDQGNVDYLRRLHKEVGAGFKLTPPEQPKREPHPRLAELLPYAAPERLAEVKALTKPATATLDYQDIIRNDNISVVYISTTPESNHFPIARDCLRAGKNVLLEKPISLEL